MEIAKLSQFLGDQLVSLNDPVWDVALEILSCITNQPSGKGNLS